MRDIIKVFTKSLPVLKQLDEFIHDDIDFEHIIRMSTTRAVIASLNDTIVPTGLSEELSKQIKAEYFVID